MSEFAKLSAANQPTTTRTLKTKTKYIKERKKNNNNWANIMSTKRARPVTFSFNYNTCELNCLLFASVLVVVHTPAACYCRYCCSTCSYRWLHFISTETHRDRISQIVLYLFYFRLLHRYIFFLYYFHSYMSVFVVAGTLNFLRFSFTHFASINRERVRIQTARFPMCVVCTPCGVNCSTHQKRRLSTTAAGWCCCNIAKNFRELGERAKMLENEFKFIILQILANESGVRRTNTLPTDPQPQSIYCCGRARARSDTTNR